MYLQAITLADLSQPNGTHLDQHMLAGQAHHSSSTTRLHPINQSRPSNHIWKLWQRANRLWSHSNGTLKKKLGSWIHTPHQLRRQWPWYYDPQRHLLWQRLAESATTNQYAVHHTDNNHSCPNVQSQELTDFSTISSQAVPIRPTETAF